jgi:flagellar basal-body rod modification protein FlgD
MSVTSATAPDSSLSYLNDTSTTTRTPKQYLDPGDFMKLLAAQMENQDPNAPMDSNQQMAQIVQISSMQNMQTMASNLTLMSASQTWSLANSYLGRQVTLTDTSGQTVSGEVTAIDASGSTPQIQVNGAYYSISQVTRIELPASTTAPAPSDTTSG